MNPFTHEHSFESPDLYKCKLVMCGKLLRSTDQSVPHKPILLTRRVSVAVWRIRV